MYTFEAGETQTLGDSQFKEIIGQITQTGIDTKNFRLLIESMRISYREGKIEYLRGLIGLLVDLVMTGYVKGLVSIFDQTMDGSGHIIDKANTTVFEGSTIQFVKDRITDERKVVFICYSGVSRSRQLSKEVVKLNIIKEEQLFNVPIGESSPGFSSIRAFAAYTYKLFKTGQKSECPVVFLFTNKKFEEISFLYESLLTYFNDAIDDIEYNRGSDMSADLALNILLGDFSSLGISKVYIIQKEG